ncbi:hypothetical protein LY76DRAFT_663174 [Colletotrichum caudatum]|nr:hypothetical protein LY76DRAFT_663174 [Colletotrichum caudatum]
MVRIYDVVKIHQAQLVSPSTLPRRFHHVFPAVGSYFEYPYLPPRSPPVPEPDHVFASPKVEAVDDMATWQTSKQARDPGARNSTFKQFGLQVEQATLLTATTNRETGKQQVPWPNRSKLLPRHLVRVLGHRFFFCTMSPSPASPHTSNQSYHHRLFTTKRTAHKPLHGGQRQNAPTEIDGDNSGYSLS